METTSQKHNGTTREHSVHVGRGEGAPRDTFACPGYLERPLSKVRALPDPSEPSREAREAQPAAAPMGSVEPTEPAERPRLSQRLRELAKRVPRPPHLSKGGKRALDLVHMMAAAVWLGGFVAALALVVLDGGSAGAHGELLESIRSYVLTPCVTLLMVSGLLYSLCTNWGFAKHGWVVAKWVLSIVAVNCCMHLPMNLTGLLVIVVLIAALFVLSVLKPRRAKGRSKGKGKSGKPAPYQARHMANKAATPPRRTPAMR